MPTKKTKKLFVTLLTLFALSFPFITNEANTNKHYVTQVIPASFTDIVQFYGNIFRLDNGYIAFCLERDKGTPQVGTELTLSSLDDPYIRKILYYGYNGPERWDGFSSDGEAILCTSIMLSDAYSGYGYKDICDQFKSFISSAPDAPSYSLSFTPYNLTAYREGSRQRTDQITVNGDSRLSTNISLDQNMKIHFSDGRVKNGTVTVYGGDSFYISAPLDSTGSWSSNALQLNENTYSAVFAVSQSEDIQDLTYLIATPNKDCGTLSINWYNKGTIEIIKSSAESKITEGNYNYSLENAQYGLYSSYNDATSNINPVIVLTTNSTGYAKAENLEQGTYYLKEITPPKGYHLSNTIQEVIINTLTTTTVNTQDVPITKPFQIIKYGETSDEENLLNGAGFMVCPVESLIKSEKGSYIWDESKAIPITKDGSLELFTSEDGSAITSPLPYGTYLVHESTVPPNFLPVSDFLVTINDDFDSTKNVIYLTDKSFKAYLQIIKQDSTTDTVILNNPATFKIWSITEEKYVSFEINDNGSTLTIDQFQTGNDGTLITPEPLMPGKYIIEEVSSPMGYLPISSTSAYVIDITNTSDYQHYVDENGEYTDMGIFSVSIENTPITSQIKIIKSLELPPESATTPSLSGIKFNIYAKETIYSPDGSGRILYDINQLVETIITDKNGVAISSSILPLGKYEVEEENIPAGYVKSENITIDLSGSNDTNTIVYTSDTDYILCCEVNITNYLKEPEVLGESYTPDSEVLEEAPTPETDTPKTGDKTSIYVFIILIISFIIGITSYKKINN